MEAGESAVLTVAVSDPCSDNCSASVTVDPDDEVAEADETNNTASWFVVG
jgi:subtilase family serine protease